MTVLAACDPNPTRLPTGLGVGGGGASSSSISGTWRRTLVMTTADDVITSETTWTFGPGGGCERTVVTTSVLAGSSDTERAPCTYRLDGSTITITFTTGTPVTFSVRVTGDRLFLDGVEFIRVG